MTASPLINVKYRSNSQGVNREATKESLQTMLSNLEELLDAELCTFATQQDSSSQPPSDANTLENQALRTTYKPAPLQQVQEAIIPYHNASPILPLSSPLLSHPCATLVHPTRKRELDQLQFLLEDLGPAVTGDYARTLLAEVSRNRYDKETNEQFRNLLEVFQHVVDYCHHREVEAANQTTASAVALALGQQVQPREHSAEGHTSKMQALASLLPNLLQNQEEAVGVVFVERRITALALHNYFRLRYSPPSAKNGEAAGKKQNWIRCDMLVRDATKVFRYLHYTHHPDRFRYEAMPKIEDDDNDNDNDNKKNGNNNNDNSQTNKQTPPIINPQDNWLHQQRKIKTILRNLRNHSLNLLIATSVVEEGIDVPACSFVIVLDDLKTTKGYVQMKGRARQQCAKLFVFRNEGVGARRPPVCLEDAREVEGMVEEVILECMERRRGEREREELEEKQEEKQEKHDYQEKMEMETEQQEQQEQMEIEKENEKQFEEDEDAEIEKLFALSSSESEDETENNDNDNKTNNSNNNDKMDQDQDQSDESNTNTPSLLAEQEALQNGSYTTSHGRVDLQSSKSLLNRYSMSIPIDPTARASRQAMTANLPFYSHEVTGSTLMLQAHLPHEFRFLSLGEEEGRAVLLNGNGYTSSGGSKRDKENRLALMACVRLHKLGVLNDRLLPLCRKDVDDRLLKATLGKLSMVAPPRRDSAKLEGMGWRKKGGGDEKQKAYLHRLVQTGTMFAQHDAALQGKGRSLALLSLKSLMSSSNSPNQHLEETKEQELPTFPFLHKELGRVECHLQEGQPCSMTHEEWKLCGRFYTVIMNARWRRRTGRIRFRYMDPFTEEEDENKNENENENEDEDKDEGYGHLCPYIVVPVTHNNTIDWPRLHQVLQDASRTEEERSQAAQQRDSASQEARLWAPMYDPNVTYVVHGPSGLQCSAPFPFDDKFADYKSYYRVRYTYTVSPESELFAVQRLWTTPRKVTMKDGVYVSSDEGVKRKPKKFDPQKVATDSIHPGEQAPCDNLKTALLPQDACIEPPLADAHLFLHCVLLPQVLYYLDRCRTTRAFLAHCRERLVQTGTYLHRLSLHNVMEALTAKSCALGVSYDRLEWLGDAVLKVIHTDALMQQQELRRWTRFLHEGDLSTLRSALGCNQRLADAATKVGASEFILTAPLGRGQWLPVGFQAFRMIHAEDPSSSDKSQSQGETQSQEEGVGGAEKAVAYTAFTTSTKCRADVIEALIGLIYLHFGLPASVEAAEEMGITIARNHQDKSSKDNDSNEKAINSASFDTAVSTRIKSLETFLRRSFTDKKLLMEATTHPSCIHEDVPCYQRLEWIGDAVLCLATRDKVFRHFPHMDVGPMVVMETTLVCNETLAFVAWQNDLMKWIQHRNAKLRGKLDAFYKQIETNERGLWGTDPPKVLADVVEALLGAAHVDGGFREGQQSSLVIMSPMLFEMEKELKGLGKTPSTSSPELQAKMRAIMHPKQAMYELAQDRLRVRIFKEHAFASKQNLRGQVMSVWANDMEHDDHSQESSTSGGGKSSCCGAFRKASDDGEGYVAQILLDGSHLGAVREATPVAAQNRACALALAVLDGKPELLRSLPPG